jgi:site-specific DNA-cytosine methylase
VIDLAEVIGFSHTQGLDCQPSTKNFPTLRANGAGMAVAVEQEKNNTLLVRRLSAVECEQLQGFPGGWGDVGADSHRYRQMGNAVTVSVIAWIGGRIA